MIKNSISLYVLLAAFAFSSCQSKSESSKTAKSTDSIEIAKKTAPAVVSADTKPTPAVATAESIFSKPQVPILCYHQIRNWTSADGQMGKDYTVQTAEFKSQMKMLSDSGYHTILPDQLYNYLNGSGKLPTKPIMLTFDDTRADQYNTAVPEMKKYGFKAVFFIMTVSIGRPHYMTKAQIKELSDAGNVVGSHTYDHQNVKKLKGEDWVKQIDKPTKTLEEITGKDIKYFAYPFGLWNKEAFPELKKRGFIAAYSLADKRDEQDPLFTIRRIIASGFWSTKTLYNNIVRSF